MRRRSALLAAAALLLLSGTAQAGAVQPVLGEAPDRAQERIQDARYLIVSENPEAGKLELAPYTVPVHPPLYFIVGSHDQQPKEQWTVRPAGPGMYTINSTTHPDAAWSRDGDGIVASEGSWSQFAIESAGDGAYRIRTPHQDSVATLNAAGREQLHVESDNGSSSQRWRFVRVAG